MKPLHESILDFLFKLEIGVSLPRNVEALNPYLKKEVRDICTDFYSKFYYDKNERSLIVGINPGRLGAGTTGVPFTDSIRLETVCGIDAREITTREPSSIFVYDVIEAFGGVREFYNQFLITSLCPLGFVQKNEKGNWVNYNFYDDKALSARLEGFMSKSMQEQIDMGVKTDKAYCLGRGKNFKHFNKLNNKYGWFDEIVPLDHPRYIVQYRSKSIPQYIDHYLQALCG